MVQIKIKAVKGSYHVFAVYDDADLFFDELAQRLKQCCIRTARFEVFFHIENLTQKDLVRLFKLCEQINLKILGFDEMPQPSIGIHEGNLRYAREYEFTEPLILFGNIEKSVSVCAKANLYVLGHVQGVLDFLYADCVLYASSLCANVRIHDTSFQNLTVFSPCKVYYEKRELKIEMVKGEKSWEKQLQLPLVKAALEKAVSH